MAGEGRGGRGGGRGKGRWAGHVKGSGMHKKKGAPPPDDPMAWGEEGAGYGGPSGEGALALGYDDGGGDGGGGGAGDNIFGNGGLTFGGFSGGIGDGGGAAAIQAVQRAMVQRALQEVASQHCLNARR